MSYEATPPSISQPDTRYESEFHFTAPSTRNIDSHPETTPLCFVNRCSLPPQYFVVVPQNTFSAKPYVWNCHL